MTRDFVDALLESWAQHRPDVDVSSVAVATRIARLRDHFEGEMAVVLGSYGLTSPTFVLLATLTRLGAVSEDAIAAELGLTRGTITIRTDRLVQDGLVTRQDGNVDLTDTGRTLVEQVVPAHLEGQARLLDPLTPDERDTLAALLRKLLLALEG